MSAINTDYAIMQATEEMTEAVAVFNLEATIEQLRAANPWAVPESAKCRGVARASKNLKKELSLKFPGVKFSVKSKSYTGGNSLRVEYIDGPAIDLVAPIVMAYERGHFNPMDDSYEYDRSAKMKAHQEVFGSCKYAFCNRSLSADVLRTASDWIEATYGEKYEIEEYADGSGSFIGLTSYHATSHVHHYTWKLLNATSF